jgi:cell division protein FtsB
VTDGPRRRPRPAGGSSSTRRGPAKKATATRAPAKRAAPRKTAATRAPAKRAAPQKAAGRRATATRSTAKRAPAKKAVASRRPLGRIAAGLAVSVVLVGFLLVGVFPTRTWLAQRDETRERQAELDRIRSEQAVHEERIEELEDPAEIEAMARRDQGFVFPGETAFQMLPGPVAPVDLPDTWPFTGADDWLNR